MSLQKILSDIIKTSKKDPKDVFQKLAKLQEETGELSDAVLRRNGLKSPKNKTINELDENILEEISDVIIVAMAILPHFAHDISDVTKMLESKYNKWKENLEKYDKWKKELQNE